MIWINGESWSSKVKRLEKWHEWYAWFPVTLNNTVKVGKKIRHKKAWLQKVLRSGSPKFTSQGYSWGFEYKELEVTE
ncbi:MAG: hypothetical protein R3254_05925 [Thiomicrorhabdus sp.]|nr:hypothetical protein [Thiomicrorhabdus sp.]